MQKPKIVVVHPGKQHSFKTASALKKEGILLKYITSVYDKKDSFVMSLTRRFSGKADRKKLENRSCEILDDNDVITHLTFFSLLVIVFSRFKITKLFSLWLDRKISDIIGKKAAKYAIKNNADAVICFSNNEKKCFEYLKKHAPYIKRIADCANTPLDYVKTVFESDKTEKIKKEVPEYWNKKIIKRKHDGILASEYFLSPSTFVSAGLKYCGIDEERIFLVPYGVNFELASEPQKEPDEVRFIYVGQVTYRKGVHYLLKAFSELEDKGIKLDVVGGFPTGKELYEEYKSFKNITFHGSLLHGDVRRLLLSSNAFVSMSLTESLSVACLEAMGSALPLIVSKNTGMADCIIDGDSGFTIEYNDTEKLKDIVTKLHSYPELIPTMSKNALNTAKNYTWKNYEKTLIPAIYSILELNESKET